ADVLPALGRDPGLLGHVLLCLCQMAVSMCRSEIAFAVLASIDQSDDVISLPRLPSLDRQLADVALALRAVVDPLPDAWGYLGVGRLPDPFRERPHETALSMGHPLLMRLRT